MFLSGEGLVGVSWRTFFSIYLLTASVCTQKSLRNTHGLTSPGCILLADAAKLPGEGAASGLPVAARKGTVPHPSSSWLPTAGRWVPGGRDSHFPVQR